MKYIGQISLASAALTTLAAAGPIKQNSKFTIHQEPNPQFNIKRGPAAVAQALGKFGLVPPPAIQAAASRNGSGSEPAIPTANDVEYLCPVTIGGQTLSLDFDTGSADLYVTYHSHASVCLFKFKTQANI